MAAVIGGLGLAGCGGVAVRTETAGAPTSTASPTVSAPADPSPPGKDAGAATLTVRGTVSAGVEAGCLLLDAGGTDYLLLGGSGPARAALRPGATVTVTGTRDATMLSTCQQGTPLVVRTVVPG